MLRPDLAFLIEMMGEICIALVDGPRGLGVSFSSVFLVDARDVLTESPRHPDNIDQKIQKSGRQ